MKQNTTASVSNWKSGTLHKAIAFPPCHRRKTVKQNSFQKIQKTVGSRLPKALQNRRSFSFMTIECSQSVHSIVYIFSEFVLLLLRYRLVLEAMDRRRNPSAAVHKCVTAELVDRHNWRIAQQSAKLNGFANTLADNGDQANSGCLVIDHTDRHFIRNESWLPLCLRESRSCQGLQSRHRSSPRAFPVSAHLLSPHRSYPGLH